MYLHSSFIVLCLLSCLAEGQFFYNSAPIAVSRQAAPNELVEGTYVEPPTVSRSAFENIGLGQAPSGVFIPQDSFLNVLKNGPLSVSYVPEQPPPSLQSSPAIQPSVLDTPVVTPSVQSNPAMQPSVQYVPENIANIEPEMPKPRNTRRQRQRTRPSSRPEPAVDIDVLRTPPDMMQSNTPVPFQGGRGTQGRSVSRSRSPLLIDNYQDTTQPPKTFGPSAFQNIGLGEAPQGVSIPADSLLNVLRNSQPPYVAPRQIPVPEPVYTAPETQEEELPPVDLPTPTNRRSRQRSNESNRTSRRRAEYQYDDRSQDVDVPEVRQQPRSSGSGRTSRRRTEARYNDGAQAMDPSAEVPRTEPQRTRITVTRTSSTSSKRGQRQQTTNKPERQIKAAALPEDEDDDGIPGVAGVDHPTLHTIPRTAFRCADQPYIGYYADLETSCQVVHLCQAGGVKNSFLCPNGTIFNQEKFSCQWWYKVNCADSPKFYGINDSLYKVDNGKENNEE